MHEKINLKNDAKKKRLVEKRTAHEYGKLQTSATHANDSLSATTNRYLSGLYFVSFCTSLQISQLFFQKNNRLSNYFFSLCKTNEKAHNIYLVLERHEKLSVGSFIVLK